MWWKKKKKPLTLIRVIRKNKNPPKESRERERERERERVLITFVWEKYALNEKNDIKFIKIKMGRRKVKLYETEKDEGSVMVK